MKHNIVSKFRTILEGAEEHSTVVEIIPGIPAYKACAPDALIPSIYKRGKMPTVLAMGLLWLHELNLKKYLDTLKNYTQLVILIFLY